MISPLKSPATSWRVCLVLVLLAGGSIAQQKTLTTENAKWQSLIPTIEKVLTKNGSTCPGQPLRVGIKDAKQLGDSSVALVDFCPGGAYTDWLVAMRLENDQPLLARFRKANKEIADVGFAEGASVMHGMDAKLMPEKNAIYAIQWDNDAEMHLTACTVTAYVWNPHEKTFDLSPNLSKQAKASYCQSLQKDLLKQP